MNKKILLVFLSVFYLTIISAYALPEVSDGQGRVLSDLGVYTIGQPILVHFNEAVAADGMRDNISLKRIEKTKAIHIENGTNFTSGQQYDGAYLQYYFNSEHTAVSTGIYTIDLDVKINSDINTTDGKWGFFYSSVSNDTKEVGRMWFRADMTHIYGSGTLVTELSKTLGRNQFYHITYILDPANSSYSVLVNGEKWITTDLRDSSIKYIKLGSYLYDANRKKTVVDICNFKVSTKTSADSDETVLLDLKNKNYETEDLGSWFTLYKNPNVPSSVTVDEACVLSETEIQAVYRYDETQNLCRITPISPVSPGDIVRLTIGTAVMEVTAAYNSDITITDAVFEVSEGNGPQLTLLSGYGDNVNALISLKNSNTKEEKKVLAILIAYSSNGKPCRMNTPQIISIAPGSTQNDTLSIEVNKGEEIELILLTDEGMLPVTEKFSYVNPQILGD